MFEQTFKNIDDKLWKDAGCSSELDYVEQTLAMSLRGGCSSRRSNLLIVSGIASGKEQVRPRNDMILL